MRRLYPIQQRSPLLSLHRQLTDIFGDMFEGLEPLGEKLGGFYPKVDVHEDQAQYTLALEVPGIDPRDIEISLTGSELTVRGNKKSEFESKEGELKVVERSWGEFSRKFTLPFDPDSDKVDAVFDKGVLKVIIPKELNERDRQKTISIRSA